MLKITITALILTSSLVLLVACGPSQADLDGTATKEMANEFAKQTAEAPTNTPVPTQTPVPTDTPVPTQTPTPTASPTPTITNTPPPTDTPEPTIPPEPTIGPILFITDDSNEPTDQFPLGITVVYACFEYWNMNPEVRITGYWYLNGKEIYSVSDTTDLVGNDITCTGISYAGTQIRKLDAGNWELKMYVEKELAQTGKFKIGN